MVKPGLLPFVRSRPGGWMGQRCQSGLKSGGSWIQVKKFGFSRKISEKFGFFQAILKKINFSGQIFEKF